MKAIYSKDIPLIPVENPHIGGKYHVAWAKRGCVWVCIEIDQENRTATLRTPKTKKLITVKLVDLRHTRSAQYKIENVKP